MFDLDAPITAPKLGGLLNLSERRVRELKASGVFPAHLSGCGLDGPVSIRNYCAALAKRAEAREAKRAEALDLRQETAKLKRAQRRHIELKNAVLEGTLVPLEELQPAWSRVARAIMTAVMAAPGRIRFQLPHLAAFDEQVIEDILREARDERRLRALQKHLNTVKLLIVDWAMCPLRLSALSCFSRYSASAMNAAQQLSRLICRSMNGRPSSAQNGLPAPCSTGSRISPYPGDERRKLPARHQQEGTAAIISRDKPKSEIKKR
jgi:phage terminase Nu1 subunit (DNA packaging protein)